MQDCAATEKPTRCPTDGVRPGCARTRTAMSPQRSTRSAALPRKVARSTTPLPRFNPLAAESSNKSTFSGRKKSSDADPGRHSTLRRAMNLLNGESSKTSVPARLPAFSTVGGNEVGRAKKVRGNSMGGTKIEIRGRPDFKQCDPRASERSGQTAPSPLPGHESHRSMLCQGLLQSLVKTHLFSQLGVEVAKRLIQQQHPGRATKARANATRCC